MRELTILLDVDGVIANFLKHAIPIIERVSGKKLPVESITDWDFFQIVGKEHEAACWKEINVEGFYRDLHPYPGAVEGVKRLQEIATVHIVTAMSYVHSKHAYYERAEWIKQHLGLSVSDITFSAHKHLMRGDVLVDDKASTIMKWARMNPAGTGVIWSHPYNEIAYMPRNVVRARNWFDVVDAVTELRNA